MFGNLKTGSSRQRTTSDITASPFPLASLEKESASESPRFQAPSPTVDDGVHFFQSFVWLMFRMGGKTKTLYLLDSTEGHVCVKKGSILQVKLDFRMVTLESLFPLDRVMFSLFTMV